MFKQEFAYQLLQTVYNARNLDRADDKEVVGQLLFMLETLQPENREQFAAWGNPDQKSTPAECW